MLNKLYFKGLAAKEKINDMFTKENGEANIIAIILVIAIVVALAIIFREQIGNMFERVWSNINGETSDVLDNY